MNKFSADVPLNEVNKRRKKTKRKITFTIYEVDDDQRPGEYYYNINIYRREVEKSFADLFSFRVVRANNRTKSKKIKIQ